MRFLLSLVALAATLVSAAPAPSEDGVISNIEKRDSVPG